MTPPKIKFQPAFTENQWNGMICYQIINPAQSPLGSSISYTADDIILPCGKSAGLSLFHFMRTIITKLKETGKTRTSETYTAALNSFRKFSGDEDISLASITSETMESYERWLRHCGLSPNTISFYNRILRAVYNRAIEQNITYDRQPFRHVYTGIGKTAKRALPLSEIKKIKNMNLQNQTQLDYARDIFMLSFYLRGMSFIDMAVLRKTDLRNGILTYRRRKTGQLLEIGWRSEMQMILDKYPRNAGPYLLPILSIHTSNELSAYRNLSHSINSNLKRIAVIAGINRPFTLYAARHSWASAARMKGIPISIISEGLGHNLEATTKIYIANLDTSSVDRANSLIIESLK